MEMAIKERETHEYTRFSGPYFRALTLKHSGKTYLDIAEELNTPYNTVAGWFRAGGLLEAAYVEYREEVAQQALSEAKGIMMRASQKAAETMVELLEHPDVNIRFKAAKFIIDKFLPNAVAKESNTVSTLPIELQVNRELAELEADNQSNNLSTNAQAALKNANV